MSSIRSSQSKARQKFLPLTSPNPSAADPKSRENWIEAVCAGFVQPSKANRAYYRVVLETLWPRNHGIPGPHVQEQQLRAAIDAFRRSQSDPGASYSPYVDAFRRIRELQGEEGVIGVARVGRTYQLVDLSLGSKRIPRVGLSESDWATVLKKYRHCCPVCHRREPEVTFDQDHKVPRVRGGGDEIENWQPLCVECNNFKSTSCRGCQADCLTCGWAFPEKYAPIRLAPELNQAVRELAVLRDLPPSQILDTLVTKALSLFQTQAK